MSHTCKLCGELATRSADHRATWLCFGCDPSRANDMARLVKAYARQAAAPADQCPACDGAGCPHCRPERFGLPARQPVSNALKGKQRRLP